MFIFGGNNSSNSFQDLYIVDLLSLECKGPVQLEGTPPSARAYHASVLYQKNKIIIIGGYSFVIEDENVEEKYLNDVFVLNTLTMRWEHPQVKSGEMSYKGSSVVMFGRRFSS